MHPLVKLKEQSSKLGFSLVETIVAFGLSAVVISLASVPLVQYVRQQRLSSERRVISILEADIFSWLSTSSTCKETLSGITPSSPQNIGAIKIQTGGGPVNILVPPQIYYPDSDVRVQSIRTGALVSTGANQGFIQVDFEIKSTMNPVLDRTRSFVVKVFTSSAGLLTDCSSNEAQDLQLFCSSLSGTLSVSNLCQNVQVAGNVTVQHQLTAETNLITHQLNVSQAGVTNTSTLGSSAVSNNIQITNTLTGNAANITVANQTSAATLDATSGICANTVNCRTFSNKTCGVGSYVFKIETNGDLTCVPRPW